MPNLPVTFYLSQGRDVARLRELDPDVDLDAFRKGEFIWVAQTYLRLRAAGHPVEFSATVPEKSTGTITRGGFPSAASLATTARSAGNEMCPVVGSTSASAGAPPA